MFLQVAKHRLSTKRRKKVVQRFKHIREKPKLAEGFLQVVQRFKEGRKAKNAKATKRKETNQKEKNGKAKKERKKKRNLKQRIKRRIIIIIVLLLLIFITYDSCLIKDEIKQSREGYFYNYY